MRLSAHHSPTKNNATRRRRTLLTAAIGAGVTSIVAATFVGPSAGVGDAQRPLITNITVTEPPPPPDPSTTPPVTGLPFPSAVPLPTAVQAHDIDPVDSGVIIDPTTSLPTTGPLPTAVEAEVLDSGVITDPMTSSAGNDGAAAPTGVATMDITSASVTCDGEIHVEYATAVGTEPSPVADHFVLYHPVSDPSAVEVAHVGGNAPNGTFVHAQPGSAGETYRLIVVALFDPASVEGASAMDQAKTVATDGC